MATDQKPAVHTPTSQQEQQQPARGPQQQEKAPDVSDLGSEEEEQRNWKGICIALLVIASVCSLIITSVVLLSPGPEEPRVKNPRFGLEEVISGSFDPRLFNGSWVSVLLHYEFDSRNTFPVNIPHENKSASNSDSVFGAKDTELIFRNSDGALAIYDVTTRQQTVLMPNSTFMQLNVHSYSISPDRKYVLLSYDYMQVFTYSYTAKYKVFIVNSGQIQPLLPDMPNAEFQLVTWGKKGSHLVYVYRNNIYYSEKCGPNVKPRALTKTGKEGVVFNGIPDWVYEAEIFHSNKAVWWSNNGSKLAFACFNDSQVETMTYPWYGSYEDSTNVYPQTIKLRYPKPGRPNPKVNLYVIDLNHSLPVSAEVIPPPEFKAQEYYLTSVQWIDEKRIIAVWLRRVQNSSVISICNSDNEWMCYKHVQEDAHYGWVEMHEEPLFSQSKENYFLRLPVADGKAGYFRHVAVFDLQSDRKDFLTHGRFDITHIVAHLEDQHSLFYITTLPGYPEQRHLFSVKDLLSENPREKNCLTCHLDENCLYFDALFSPDSKYFILECLGPGVPRIELRSSEDNELVEVFDSNNDLREVLENRALPQILTFKVPLKNGYDANVRLYLPPPLRENEIIKYPMVLYVCGGPGTQLVTEKFHIHWGSYLASYKNYIYAYIDGRGSGYQGDKRVHEVFRRLGVMEVEDQLIVTSYLKSNLLYIDGDRVALWGWSYGGYTTISVLAADSDIFACGISVAPITSWLYYDSVYSERYMQNPKPEDNYIGYEKADVTVKAENMRGKKFLLVHGTADDNVHFQHSMMLIKALTNAGVLFRTQIYPDEKHSLINVKMHLYYTMEDFLDYTCFKDENVDLEEKS